MAHIRTKAELDAMNPTMAELYLIECCQKGEHCELGDGKLPPDGAPAPDREVRASVLRYLLLGGCKTCKTDDIGVWMSGANITGVLDLNFCTVKGAMRLEHCRFDHRLDTQQTTFAMINLSDSHLNGWFGQRLSSVGSIYLRRITATATIDLMSATIGGQLACERAQFKAAEGDALNAQRVKVTDTIFLSRITTKATVDLIGATIGGQLDCEGAQFEATKGFALNAQTIHVGAALIWRKVKTASASLNFDSAHFGVLADDLSSWPDGNRTQLDGMTYDRIAEDVDARSRLNWLASGSNWNGVFAPQPYTQLAKVLRDMGHDTDARSVLAERDRLLGPQNRKGLHNIARNWIWRVWYVVTHPVRWLADQIFRLVAGYGHKPFRSLGWLLAFWLTAVCLSHKAWDAGDFAPASAVLLASPEWTLIAASDVPNPAKMWSERQTLPDGSRTYVAGQDWSTFSSFAYAADLVIPIINLGQTDTWGPSTERGPWGKRLWRYGFLLQIAGWIVTALGAAAITGLIRRD
jgi:hypothetical protein